MWEKEISVGVEYDGGKITNKTRSRPKLKRMLP